MSEVRSQAPAVDVLAARAYQAFCEAARGYAPAQQTAWEQLPETLRTCWKKAAAAVIDSH